MGSVGSLNTGEEGLADFEPVPREMKGKEAIKIVDLFKSFKVSRYLKIGLHNLLIYDNNHFFLILFSFILDFS